MGTFYCQELENQSGSFFLPHLLSNASRTSRYKRLLSIPSHLAEKTVQRGKHVPHGESGEIYEVKSCAEQLQSASGGV